MKKHHFIKMSSIALSLCVALGTFPATAFADDANATTITKAYVDKATYTPGEAATIYVDVDGATGTKTAHIQITHLNETIWENDVTFTANGGKTTVPISWTPPTTDHQGYLVSITIDQFITAYENLLYDADVLPSDTGFQNISISNETISGDAKQGTIWYVIKNKGDDYGLIHLINLTSENDEDWRNVTGTPNTKQNLTIKYYIPQYKDISGVYCATPDTGCISNALAYNVQTDDVGKYVEIQVPSLEYWDMIYIRYNNNTLTDTVEAENSILTNVSTNNNHGGYSGTGFVDSYGKAGDAVTMDFFVPETGDYKLSFVYSAAVDGTPKRELYINAYGYDSISFPATSNWEEWNTSETTVHLRAGIQRMVVYCGNADDGYINFDCVHISKSA